MWRPFLCNESKKNDNYGNILSDAGTSLKSPNNDGGDGAQNVDEELRGIASANQNAISIIEKNIDLDHEICQCKCMKKFDTYMEARNVTNMFVYNWNSIVKISINKC